MKKFFLLLLLGFASAAYATNSGGGDVTKSTSGATKNDIDEDLNVAAGRTWTVKPGGTAVFNGVFNGTPTGGTFNFSNVTVTFGAQSGSGLTALNASNLATGTVGVARLPALTGGDATTSTGSGTITLGTVNSNTGIFGSATQVAQVTLDGKGRATAAGNVTITPAVGNITGLGTNVGTALAANANTSGGFSTGSGTVALTNKDISDATNTYRAATTSVSGAVTIAGNANAVTGTSTSLVPSVDDVAREGFAGLGYPGIGMRRVAPLLTGAPPKIDTSTGQADALSVGARRNIGFYSEDLTWTYWVATNGSKNTSDTITWNGITLTRWTSSSYFYGSLAGRYNSAGLTPFTTGHTYLVSYYIKSVSAYPYSNSELKRSQENFFVMGTGPADGTSTAAGKRLIDSSVRRVWKIIYATSSTAFDYNGSAVTAWGSGSTTTQLDLFSTACSTTVPLDVYVGGLQIEDVSSSALKDAVVVVGDSTIAGGSGGYDSYQALEVPSFAESLLNVQFYNRAVGGWKTSDIISNWSTTATWGASFGSPHDVAPKCRYCLIQGGINDVGQDVSAATIQTNLTSIAALAAADGLTPVFLTITPLGTSTYTSGRETIRQTVNTWIRSQARYIDADAIVADPLNPAQIRRQSGWDLGDGGPHYQIEAKRAIGFAVAQWSGWEFTKPSPYQKIATTNYTMPGVTVAGGAVQHFFNNYSTSSQSPAAATRTYITGSGLSITAGQIQQGTIFRWRFNMTKTAAGTASSTIDIAFGTAGTTSDTARVSFTKPAGTAAIDEGWVEIEALVRTNSASGVVVGEFIMSHNGNTVGHATIPVVVLNTVSSTFDTTTPTKIGLCITTGASDAITIQQVSATAINL